MVLCQPGQMHNSIPTLKLKNHIVHIESQNIPTCMLLDFCACKVVSTNN